MNNTQTPDTTPKPKVSRTKRQRAKKRARRRIRQNRTDDIPECPSMEDVVYYDGLIPSEAMQNPSDLTVANSVDSKHNEEMREARDLIGKTLARNQREIDLRQVYGIPNSGSESSETDEGEQTEAYKQLIKPFKATAPTEQSKSETNEEKQKRREKRRKQAKELFDNILWAVLSGLQQSFVLLEKSFKYSSKYPTPFGLVILIFGLYCMTFFLELSVAAFAEWCIQWFWPTTRLLLRSTERGLRGLVGFLEELDDLGQSTYCDMADLWCSEFGLMCQRKCSFLDMALMRSRL